MMSTASPPEWTEVEIEQVRAKLLAGSPWQFEALAADILRNTGLFAEVRKNAVIDGFEADVVAAERPVGASPGRRWFFEIRAIPMLTIDAYSKIVLHAALLKHAQDPDARFVIVLLGEPTRAVRERALATKIDIWTLSDLLKLAHPEDVARFLGERGTAKSIEQRKEKARALKLSLEECKLGDDGWSAYQQLVAEVFAYMFCPPLQYPRYELPDADGRNRRDLIMENSAPDGFWSQVRTTYAADYIVIDAKNYADPIKKRSVVEIAHYLKPYGCGLFGIIACRKGAGVAAKHAIREQWIAGRKMIVVLDDTHLAEMLTLKEDGSTPEEVIRKLIADFRMSL